VSTDIVMFETSLTK